MLPALWLISLLASTVLSLDNVQFPFWHVELRSPSSTSTIQANQLATLSLKTKPTTVYRSGSTESLEAARLRSRKNAESIALPWHPVEVAGPDVQDRHTLAQLARMSGDAYSIPGKKGWYDLDYAWNTSFPFGWEDHQDGFRGHVFLSSDNSTVVLAIKGTTLQGSTSKKDKFNDNLLFSCCCAFVDISWVFRTVCGCHSSRWRCDNECVSDALIEDSLFYSVGVNIVNDLLLLYPTSNIWLVGHSLGGALASLLGSTYGLPAVAFEAPGERLAAGRLHIPLPPPLPGTTSHPVPITHVYINSDPIPLGTCTGFGSPCYEAGYALESRCHLGKSIVFDTVEKLGWPVDVRKHVIKNVIHNVLEADVDDWEDGRSVPLAREEEGCVDCFKWDFYESGGDEDDDDADVF